MPYPTVLVHLDNGKIAAGRIRAAAALAAQVPRGHLVGLALTGVSRFLYRGEPPADDPNLTLHLSFVREQAVEAVAAFRHQAEACGVASFEGQVVDDEAGAGLALHARVADLVVLGQAAPAAHGKPPAPDCVPYVLLHAGRPVLLLPAAFDAGADAAIGRHVLVAWDASQAAGRALLGALPLLQLAESVRIAVVDEGPGGRALLDVAVADPLPFLARHGVRATLEVHQLAGRHSLLHRDAVGDALLSLAAVNGADLLVMGAYGHSRMRVTILGGVTRTVLAAMMLPVLMEH